MANLADGTVTAGVARVVITPPVGIPMTGFAGRGVSTDVHDDLTATALVLGTDAGPILALVCCDLLSLNTAIVNRIRAAVRERTGLADDAIVIASSHTHYGPITSGDGLTVSDAANPMVAPYLDNLVHTIAGTVAMAAVRMVPSTLRFGSGAVSVGINRREHRDGRVVLGQNPDGPFDPTVRVLRIDSADGQPLASVLNYACHPVSLGSTCTHISADFPGVARRVMEDNTGAMCLFLQGAAADINPLLMGWEWNHLARLGLPLGAEGVRTFWSAEPIDEPTSITTKRTVLQLPPMLPDSEPDALKQIEELAQRQEHLATNDPESGEAYWTKARLNQLRRGVAVLRKEAEPIPTPADVTAVALGREVGLISAPGEIFTEIGQRIVDGSAFPQTLYAGYTDGSVNYVPTRSAYPEGGYEVTHGCHVAPEAGEQLEAASIELLAAVRGA